MTKLDSRQSRQRSVLDQISNATDLRLDKILNLINDELQMPLRLRQADPASRTLNIDTIAVTTTDGSDGHSRTRTIQPINGVMPSFTSGSITFPASSGGSITASGLTLASSYTLTVAAGEWIKVLLALNTDGQIVLTFGVVGASESAAGFPDVDIGTLTIGYVSLQNIGGTIQNIAGSNIYQFEGGGGGTGGSGGGTFKNYLNAWFDGEKSISNLSDGGVSQTGDRTAPDGFWASTNISDITIERTATNPVRGKNSIKVSTTWSGGGDISGGVFVESPTFTLDAVDVDSLGNELYLYLSFMFNTQSYNDLFDAVIVRYDASNVYQETISIKGTRAENTSTPPSQVATGDLGRYFGHAKRIAPTPVSSDDKYAIRIRRCAGFAGLLMIDDLYLGPNADIGSTDMRFIGSKEFVEGVKAEQGINIPNNLNIDTTLVIPTGETKIAGRLDIQSGVTITVESGADLVTVGSITGPGTLDGSGTVTSI